MFYIYTIFDLLPHHFKKWTIGFSIPYILLRKKWHHVNQESWLVSCTRADGGVRLKLGISWLQVEICFWYSHSTSFHPVQELGLTLLPLGNMEGPYLTYCSLKSGSGKQLSISTYLLSINSNCMLDLTTDTCKIAISWYQSSKTFRWYRKQKPKLNRKKSLRHLHSSTCSLEISTFKIFIFAIHSIFI